MPFAYRIHVSASKLKRILIDVKRVLEELIKFLEGNIVVFILAFIK